MLCRSPANNFAQACFALMIVFLSNGMSSAIAQTCGPDSRCIDDAPPSCRAGDDNIRTVRGCEAAVTAVWKGLSNPTTTASCTANPPRGYELVDIRLNKVIERNGRITVSKFSAGLDFNYEEQSDEAYKSALELAGKLVDPGKRADVEAKLNEEWSQNKRMLQKIKTNQDTVMLVVSAQGDGSMIDRKRGWAKASVDMKVRCVAPVDLDEQILVRHNLDKVKGALPTDITFVNDENTQAYLHLFAADKFTKCSPSDRADNLSLLLPGKDIRLFVDPILEYCFKLTPKMTDRPYFSNDCRIGAGGVVKVKEVEKCASKKF